MSHGREEKIFMFEIVNEGFQNGPAIDELRTLTRNLQNKTNILVAATSAQGGAFDGAYGMSAIYADGVGDVATMHFDRSGDPWHHVRQPYGANTFANAPGLIADNEPIGPGSSGSSENEPIRLAMEAAICYVSGVGTYVLHTGAGIRGAVIPGVCAQANFWDYSNINDIFQAFRTVRNLLPYDLPNWDVQNTNNNFPNRPWDFEPTNASDTDPPYINRMYSANNGNRFVSLPIGVYRDMAIRARRNMSKVTVYNPLNGAVLQEKSVNTGELVSLSSNPPAYIITGTYA
jgi:hypothetical protein